MNIKSIDPANCFCGKPLRYPYQQLTGECSDCEDRREADKVLSEMCDPRGKEADK